MFSPLIVALNFSCWRYERYFKKASAISFMQIYTGCRRSVCAIFRNANRWVFAVHCNLFKKAKFETNIHSFEKEFLHLRIVDLFTQIFQKSTNFDLPIILGYYDDYNKRQQYLDKKEKRKERWISAAIAWRVLPSNASLDKIKNYCIWRIWRCVGVRERLLSSSFIVFGWRIYPYSRCNKFYACINTRHRWNFNRIIWKIFWRVGIDRDAFSCAVICAVLKLRAKIIV